MIFFLAKKKKRTPAGGEKKNPRAVKHFFSGPGGITMSRLSLSLFPNFGGAVWQQIHLVENVTAEFRQYMGKNKWPFDEILQALHHMLASFEAGRLCFHTGSLVSLAELPDRLQRAARAFLEKVDNRQVSHIIHDAILVNAVGAGVQDAAQTTLQEREARATQRAANLQRPPAKTFGDLSGEFFAPTALFSRSSEDDWNAIVDTNGPEESDFIALFAKEAPSLLVLRFFAYNLMLYSGLDLESTAPLHSSVVAVLFACAKIFVGPYLQGTPHYLFPMPQPSERSVKAHGAKRAQYMFISRLEMMMLHGNASCAPASQATQSFQSIYSLIDDDLKRVAVIGLMFGEFFFEALATRQNPDVTEPQMLSLAPFSRSLILGTFVVRYMSIGNQYFLDSTVPVAPKVSVHQNVVPAKALAAQQKAVEKQAFYARKDQDQYAVMTASSPFAVNFGVPTDKVSEKAKRMSEIVNSLSQLVHQVRVLRLSSSFMEARSVSAARDAGLRGEKFESATFENFKTDLRGAALNHADEWRTMLKHADWLRERGHAKTLRFISANAAPADNSLSLLQTKCAEARQDFSWDSQSQPKVVLEQDSCTRLYKLLKYGLATWCEMLWYTESAKRQQLFAEFEEAKFFSTLTALESVLSHAVHSAMDALVEQEAVLLKHISEDDIVQHWKDTKKTVRFAPQPVLETEQADEESEQEEEEQEEDEEEEEEEEEEASDAMAVDE